MSISLAAPPTKKESAWIESRKRAFSAAMSSDIELAKGLLRMAKWHGEFLVWCERPRAFRRSRDLAPYNAIYPSSFIEDDQEWIFGDTEAKIAESLALSLMAGGEP